MLIRPQRGSYIVEQVVRIKVRSSACWFRFDVWRFARLGFALFGRLLSKMIKWRNKRQQKVKVKYKAGASISHDTGVKSAWLQWPMQSKPPPPTTGSFKRFTLLLSNKLLYNQPHAFSITLLLHAHKRSLSRWIWLWCTSCWKYDINALKAELSYADEMKTKWLWLLHCDKVIMSETLPRH